MKHTVRKLIVVILGLSIAYVQAFAQVVVVPLGGDTYRAAVPKTGQAICYDVTSGSSPAVIPCKYSGQDGEFQAGIAPVAPRFTDNGDGTVRDNFTGLIWLKNANCRGINTVETADTSMVKAYAFVEDLNTQNIPAIHGIPNNCGDTAENTDWRIPNRFELESLLDLGEVDPALPTGHPFQNVVSSGKPYWTSSYVSYFAPDFGIGWTVHFSSGAVLQNQWVNATETANIWPVRGGVL